MTRKIDVREIFFSHVRTLRSVNSEGLRWDDIAVFYVFPAVAAGLFLWFSPSPSPDTTTKIDEVLLSAFSIFAGLLLNIQVFILGYRVTEKDGSDADRAVTDLAPEDKALAATQQGKHALFFEELFANLSYAILTAILIISITMLSLFFFSGEVLVFRAVQFFLILHFLLTLLMVLKRIHALFYALVSRT